MHICINIFVEQIKKFHSYKKNHDVSNCEKELLETCKKPRKILWVVVIIFALYCLWVIRSDVSVLKSTFVFLLNTDNTYYALSSTASGIGTLSMFVELLGSVFAMLQVLLPPMILYYIARAKISNKIKYIISFILCGAISVVSTESRIDAIFSGIALLITARDVYGKKFDKIFSRGILGIGVVAIIGLAIKSGVFSETDVAFGEISAMSNAYFSGVPTVAMGMEFVKNELSLVNTWRIIPDILVKIPYFSYALNLLLGIRLPNSNGMFNTYLALMSGRNTGQILPTTALGYEYFGIFLGPLVTCAMISLALYFEKQIKDQKDIVRRHLYNWITICVAISPVIASAHLIMAKISWFLIILFLLEVSNKIKDRRRRKVNYIK